MRRKKDPFDWPRVNFPFEILKENTTSNRSHVNNAKKIETSIEWITLSRYIHPVNNCKRLLIPLSKELKKIAVDLNPKKGWQFFEVEKYQCIEIS